MAYSYTFPNTNILFSNLENTLDSGQFGSKHGAQNDYSKDPAKIRVKPFINAVEIDWNGAKLGDTIIKIMGESVLFKGCSA